VVRSHACLAPGGGGGSSPVWFHGRGFVCSCVGLLAVSLFLLASASLSPLYVFAWLPVLLAFLLVRQQLRRSHCYPERGHSRLGSPSDDHSHPAVSLVPVKDAALESHSHGTSAATVISNPPSHNGKEPLQCRSGENNPAPQHIVRLIEETENLVPSLLERLHRINRHTEKVGLEIGEILSSVLQASEAKRCQTLEFWTQLGDEKDGHIVMVNREVLVLRAEIEALAVWAKEDEVMAIRAVELAAYATRISQTVAKIGLIASDVSLLALNASLEAARVGASGGAFALVAHVISREIQRLSQTAARAAEQISRLAGEAGKDLTELGQEFRRRADESAARATRAEETGANISTRIETVTREMNQMVAAVKKADETTADAISRAVVSLQFQDITRQGIEHVAELLRRLRDAAEGTRYAVAGRVGADTVASTEQRPGTGRVPI